MDYIYLINNNLFIIKNKSKAIELSLLYPEKKIEVYVKKIVNNGGGEGRGYIPTNNYYKNGIYYNN